MQMTGSNENRGPEYNAVVLKWPMQGPEIE